MRRGMKLLVAIALLAVIAVIASGLLMGRGGGTKASAIGEPAPKQTNEMVNADAAAAPSGADPFVFQYAAEFLCGTIPAGAPGASLAAGTYNTDIGIHNPNIDQIIYIEKKVVPMPPPENEGLPTPRRYETMHADGAKEIDCNDILTFFPAGTTCFTTALPFCKGYVVVESAKPIVLPAGTSVIAAQLDVTDTTTVTSPNTQDVAIERHIVPLKAVNYPCWSVTAVPPCP